MLASCFMAPSSHIQDIIIHKRPVFCIATAQVGRFWRPSGCGNSGGLLVAPETYPHLRPPPGRHRGTCASASSYQACFMWHFPWADIPSFFQKTFVPLFHPVAGPMPSSLPTSARATVSHSSSCLCGQEQLPAGTEKVCAVCDQRARTSVMFFANNSINEVHPEKRVWSTHKPAVPLVSYWIVIYPFCVTLNMFHRTSSWSLKRVRKLPDANIYIYCDSH